MTYDFWEHSKVDELKRTIKEREAEFNKRQKELALRGFGFAFLLLPLESLFVENREIIDSESDSDLIVVVQ